jgi:inward rectifier potassium channel
MIHRPRARVVIGPDGAPHLRRGVRRAYLRDWYHYSMTAPWSVLITVSAIFIAANLLFALGYALDHGLRHARPDYFTDALFFSMQTMMTIGSDTMAPQSIIANVMVCMEAMIGLTGFAVLTGLTFARFARPTARVRFSRFAVVSDRHRIPSLMFRVANERENHLLEAQIHVVLILSETTEEGEHVRRFHDLELVRDCNALFALSWTAIHQITERSPLFGKTSESLSAQQAVVVVSLTGLDETLLQTVPARHTYGPSEIVFGARLADILKVTDDGSSWMIDSAEFDAIVPAPLTRQDGGREQGSACATAYW